MENLMQKKSNKPKTAAIIQARMTSTRLPGKVLLPLGEKTVLEQVVDRIKMAVKVDEIVVAIPDNPQNKQLALFIRDKMKGVSCYKYPGPEDEVMDRTIQAAKSVKADVIVDVTSDCPCVDPALIDQMVMQLRSSDKLEYVSNVIERTWPDGFDVQVYTLRALKRVDPYVQIEKHRTHSGWNIIQYYNKTIAKGININNIIKNIKAPKKYCCPDMRVTLDTKEDYELLKDIFDHFHGKKYPTYVQIINYVLKKERVK